MLDSHLGNFPASTVTTHLNKAAFWTGGLGEFLASDIISLILRVAQSLQTVAQTNEDLKIAALPLMFATSHARILRNL